MGQTLKGVVWLVAAIVLYPAFGLGEVVAIVSAIDGFMVGRVLQSGRAVREWQFFPQ